MWDSSSRQSLHVVFGSRGYVLCGDCETNAPVTLAAGANVADRCVLLRPGCPAPPRARLLEPLTVHSRFRIKKTPFSSENWFS